VNDRARGWHGSFAAALRRRYPHAQQEFIKHISHDRIELGSNVIVDLDAEIAIVSMVAQAGYGPSKTPRLRYEALRECLVELAREARARSASVHMPRIGTGEAGGRWSVVSGLVDEELVAQGVPVTVYDPPGRANTASQPELPL
jgi:O-acetyl-ADP-ribose deacetylase (regulator of RNase III)